MLAPKSKTTLKFFLFGHNAANAGLSIPFNVFRISLEITSNAPVLPEDIIISHLFSLTDSIDFHILVSLPNFIESLTLNSFEITFSQLTTLTLLSSLILKSFKTLNTSFDFPKSVKETSDLLSFKNKLKPSTTLKGAFSPPIASNAMLNLKLIK